MKNNLGKISRSLTRSLQYGGILVLAVAISVAVRDNVLAAQIPPKKIESPIPVHYAVVREQAKITFQQDSTQTDEKYYLETMDTGVAWVDYDQDGLMDL
jgi:hypothetical protein